MAIGPQQSNYEARLSVAEGALKNRALEGSMFESPINRRNKQMRKGNFKQSVQKKYGKVQFLGADVNMRAQGRMNVLGKTLGQGMAKKSGSIKKEGFLRGGKYNTGVTEAHGMMQKSATSRFTTSGDQTIGGKNLSRFSPKSRTGLMASERAIMTGRQPFGGPARTGVMPGVESRGVQRKKDPLALRRRQIRKAQKARIAEYTKGKLTGDPAKAGLRIENERRIAVAERAAGGLLGGIMGSLTGMMGLGMGGGTA